MRRAGMHGLMIVVLALWIAGLAISPFLVQAADEGPPAVQVPLKSVLWRDGQGAWHQGVAPVAAVDTYLAARADHRERNCLALALDLDEEIEDRFDTLFDAYDARVPEFTDWVFDWETSYYRYYDVIKFAGLHLYENLERGEVAFDTDAIRHRIADEILDNFSTIVIHQDETQAALAGLEAEMADDVAQRITKLRDEETGRLNDFLKLGVTETASRVVPPDASRFDDPDTAVLGSLGRQPPATPFAFQMVLPSVASVFVLDDELSESMLMRTPRPILARLLGVGIRIAAGLSIWRVAREVAETTELGMYGYATGLLAGIAIAIATAWTMDYGLSLADEVLNRHQYEERIHVLLDRLKLEMQNRWARASRQAVLPACLGNDTLALNR